MSRAAAIRPARSPLKSAMRPLLLLLLLFYLAFHALSGDRGVYAWFKESKRLENLRAELSLVRAERERLEKNVKLLSSSSLDLDMLDERARAVLGYAGADEVVILEKNRPVAP